MEYVKDIGGKYLVRLRIPPKIGSNGNNVDNAFDISDATGNSKADLEPLMGAGGHAVIISSDVGEFLHVHPTKDVDSAWKGGPEVHFSAFLPKPGIYKTWGQFQHKGRTITAGFVLEAT